MEKNYEMKPSLDCILTHSVFQKTVEEVLCIQCFLTHIIASTLLYVKIYGYLVIIQTLPQP